MYICTMFECQPECTSVFVLEFLDLFEFYFCLQELDLFRRQSGGGFAGLSVLVWQ